MMLEHLYVEAVQDERRRHRRDAQRLAYLRRAAVLRRRERRVERARRALANTVVR